MSRRPPSVWLRPEPSARKPRWTRDQIASTALAIADEEGFAAVSMRRVAQALGAGTMSVYYYVKTRDELVALMDDALMGETLLPSPRSDWPDALLEIARRTRAVYVRHPWALVALRPVPPGPNAMRHMEQSLQAVAETRLEPKEQLTVLAMVDDFVMGHALRDAEHGAPIDKELVRAQIASGAFPRLAETFAKGVVLPNEDRFERGLRALIGSVSVPKRAHKRAKRLRAE